MPDKWYPKVLMVSRQEVSDSDTSGVSRGRWFRNWPKARIAQVYSSPAPAAPPFCPIRFRFASDDRRFGKLFGRLKYSSWGDAFRNQRVPVQQSPACYHRIMQTAKTKVVEWVAASGIWELLFATRMSHTLIQACKEFQPDLVYSVCTDLSHMELTLQIVDALGLPLCLQVEDDWLGSLYGNGIARVLLRRRVEQGVKRLLSISTTRLSNGPAMSCGYLRDYGVTFEPVFLSDDIARFDAVPDNQAKPGDGHVIVYSGSLGQNRHDGILDLDAAVDMLPQEIGPVAIRVFTYHVPMEVARMFSRRPRIELNPGLSDDAVPAALKASDVLILPESFRPDWRHYMRYSISSKAHLYMMAGRPCIVYGPAGVGVVEYAREERWARLVDVQSPTALSAALLDLLTNPWNVKALVERARAVALKNHDAQVVREQFRQALVRCATRQT
jgi:glycosyltransferase involved in cell wall biosynthesis